MVEAVLNTNPLRHNTLLPALLETVSIGVAVGGFAGSALTKIAPVALRTIGMMSTRCSLRADTLSSRLPHTAIIHSTGAPSSAREAALMNPTVRIADTNLTWDA